MPPHVHVHAESGRLRWIRRIDALGIALSALCIVHCALTPILIVVLPFAAGHEFDLLSRIALVGLGVVGVGTGALLHRNWRALPLLGLAVTLLLGLAGVEAVTGQHLSVGVELTFGVAASLLLMGAHLRNTRACRDSDHDCPPGRWLANGLGPGKGAAPSNDS